jgi:hypothetical protein
VDMSDRIGSSLVSAVLGKEYQRLPVITMKSAAQLREYVGTYRFGSGYDLQIELRGKDLVAKSVGGESWSLSTIGDQLEIDRSDPLLPVGMKTMRAIIEGDYETHVAAVAPDRRDFYNQERTKARAENLAKSYGKLVRISPLKIVTEKSGGKIMAARVTFEREALYMHLEFNKEGQMVGLFYGPTLPAEVQLIPSEADTFFIDAFNPEQKDYLFSFVRDGGTVRALRTIGEKPVEAKRISP